MAVCFKEGKPLKLFSLGKVSGQISSRPHTSDFPQMVVKSKGNGTPYNIISGFSRLAKYYSIYNPFWKGDVFFGAWFWRVFVFFR